MPTIPNPEALHAFVAAAAEMRKDGDTLDGHDFELENDDAWAGLLTLIAEARALLGLPQEMAHTTTRVAKHAAGV